MVHFHSALHNDASYHLLTHIETCFFVRADQAVNEIVTSCLRGMEGELVVGYVRGVGEVCKGIRVCIEVCKGSCWWGVGMRRRGRERVRVEGREIGRKWEWKGERRVGVKWSDLQVSQVRSGSGFSRGIRGRWNR